MNKNIVKKRFIEKLKTMDEVVLFLIITFSFVVILTIISAYGIHHGKGIPSDIHMLTPAMSVMLVVKLKNKDGVYPKDVFNYFLGFSFFIMFIFCIDQFINGDSVFGLGKFLIIPASLIFLLVLGNEKKEVLLQWKLRDKNYKKSLKYIAPYIAFSLIYTLILSFILGVESFKNTFYNMIDIRNFLKVMGFCLVNFISFLTLFGEEYGWRFFLQPRLQKKFGVRKGVILVGVIWAVWHFNFIYLNGIIYGNMEGKYMFALWNRLVDTTFIGIVIGYFYLKSESIWCVSFIHCLYVPLITQYWDITESVIFSFDKNILIIKFILFIVIKFVIAAFFLKSKVFNKKIDVVI